MPDDVESKRRVMAPRGVALANAVELLAPSYPGAFGDGKAAVGHAQCALLALPADNYRKSLSSCLRRQGLTIVEAGTARATVTRLITGDQPNVIVAADDLPDMPGFELLTRLRYLGITTPIALLTDTYSEVREEVALECGAAEFLSRSQRYSIIMKRLRLLAAGSKRHREHEPSVTENLRIGHLVLNVGSHRTTWRGRTVPLTVTEHRIVRLLACQADMTLSYRDIYDVVHGPGFRAGEGPDGYRTNVRSLIRKIRRRFRALDGNFEQIENYQGIGYCWHSRLVATDGREWRNQ